MVLEQNEYFYCLVPGAYLAREDTSDGSPLSLGVLLTLWRRSQWIDKCSHCHSTVFIIGAYESISSGMCIWWGLCPTCSGDPAVAERRFQQGTKESPADDFYSPALELLKLYSNQPVFPISKTDRLSGIYRSAMDSYWLGLTAPLAFADLLRLFQHQNNDAANIAE